MAAISDVGTSTRTPLVSTISIREPDAIDKSTGDTLSDAASEPADDAVDAVDAADAADDARLASQAERSGNLAAEVEPETPRAAVAAASTAGN